MKFAAVLLSFVVSASASLTGLTPNSVSGNFDLVNVNPTAGTAVSAQKSVVIRPGGSLSVNNVLVSSSDIAWSLQADAAGAAYLVRQDLRVGGRREECMISTSVKPISILADPTNANAAVATAIASSTISLYRFEIDPSNRVCKTSTLLTSVPSANSVAALTASSFGDNIFFATEASTGFSSSSGAEIRSYKVSASSADLAYAPVTLSGIFITQLEAVDAKTVIVKGYDAGVSTNTFGSWTVDLEAATVSAIVSATSASEELSYTGAYIASSSQLATLKLKTPTTGTTVNLATNDYSGAATSSVEVTSTSSITIAVSHLFNVAELSATAVNEASSTNAVSLSGPGLFAGTSSTSLAVCRFTINSATTTSVATGSSTSDNVECQFTIPAAATDGTLISIEFAADGINYGPATTFRYGASSVSSLQFLSSSYALADGVAFPSNRAPITVSAFDASGNKMLFMTSSATVTLAASSSDTSFVSETGTSATSNSGVFQFPNYAVDSFSSSAADNMGSVTLTATSGSVSVQTAATIRHVASTSGTVFAFTLNSAAFGYALVNPTATTSLSTGTRSVTSTHTVALGVSAFDADNNVYNTIEIDSAGDAYLVGSSIRTSTTSTAGTGICKIPTTTGVRDTPLKIAYSKTNSDGSVEFNAVRILSSVTGSNLVLYTITRAQESASTTTCTIAVGDQLPQEESAYSQVTFLNNGRIAIFERDSVFSSSQNAILSVWTMSTTTAAGSWQIRNKNLGFSVAGVTQSGDNELSVSGSITVSGTVTTGVWLVDLSDDASSIIAPTVASDKFVDQGNEQAYFLAAGSADAPADARIRASISQKTTTGTDTRLADTVRLTRGSTALVDATATDKTGAGFIDMFTIRDASVASVSPSTIASTVTTGPSVTVTANDVISSAQVKCRFSSPSFTVSSDFTVDSTATTVSFPSDGTEISCGTLPAQYVGSNAAVFVQISIDNGENYGPGACITVGSGSCPTVLGVTATATAVPANPVTNSGLDITRTKAFIARALPFTTANCASLLALVQTEMAAQSISLSGRNECLEIDAATVATGRLRSLNTGTQQNVEFTDAAEKAKADTHLATTAGQAFLTNNGLEASDVTTAAVAAEDEDDDLTDGEIAGIVIGSIAGVALIGALIAFALKGSSSSSAAPAAAPAATYAARDVTAGSSSGSYDSTSGSYDSDYSSGSYDSEDYSGSYDGSTGSYSDYV